MAHEAGLKRISLQFVGDPTYLAFNEPLFRLGSLLTRLTPRGVRIHIMGEYVAL